MASGPAGPADGELVRAARRGELTAFEVLVERYQRQATAVAYRLLSSREDAMDVVQDAFLKAYDRLETLSQPGRFGAWLMRIVSNLSLNFRRARALRRMDSLEAPGDDDSWGGVNRPDPVAPDPAAEASAGEMKLLLARAIEALPEMQRQALVLFSIEKLPQKEIADMLGCSVEAVKWHVFAARKKLKEQFKDYL
ncbi:MAG TPA: RNA polymerase sigma factor [Phycisphaerae bacterium]|nr:RNA polymerase sigma factor [Phycisphaerae bacterium]